MQVGRPTLSERGLKEIVDWNASALGDQSPGLRD